MLNSAGPIMNAATENVAFEKWLSTMFDNIIAEDEMAMKLERDLNEAH
jgi:hypothetical protein